MAHCISCGKLIRNVTFCPFCGKMQKDVIDEKANTQNNSMQNIIIIAFFGVIILTIVFLMQNKSSDESLQLSTPLLEDRIIGVNTPSQQDASNIGQTRREGYDLSERSFDNRDYEYDEQTKDFRLVCSKSCPVGKDVLNQEFAAISYAVSTLRGLTQSDLDKDLLPFEVHASEDPVCPMIPNALAYMTTFKDNNGYSRGLLCFFFDKINYDRSKFPYSTSVHEVTHLFEAGKIKHNAIIWEGISEMLESFFVKGNDRNSFCWEGNAWFKDVIKRSDDPHWVGGDLFFELCRQYGFDYDDLPELFRQLDARNGNVDEQTFVGIINKIVGSDTSQLFRNAGVI